MINIIKDTKITKFHQNLLRLQLSEVEMAQSQKKAQKMGMICPIGIDCITGGQKTNLKKCPPKLSCCNFSINLFVFSAMKEVRRLHQENQIERA